jgi:SOS-response transcriptional repressor LexA
VGQTFIFTHKFALLKDFSMMFKEHTNRYTIQRVLDTPQIKDESNFIEKYHDEYAYLFRKIYDFVKTPPDDTSDYLQYPNIARRVLEGFLTFKLPNSSTLMDKVLELEQGRSTAAGRAVMRLLNNHSHLRVISSSDLADDIDTIAVLPDILNNLMEFIKHHDKRHYDTLAKLCDPQYNVDGNAVEVIRFPKREINFYTMTASAGPGDFLENDPTATTLEVTNQECTFAVKISGDSMEPDVHDGDIVLVKSCEEVPNAHKGVVMYKGVCYCKKLVRTDRGLLLVSLNKGYDPILVESVDEYHLFGEVVEIIHAAQNAE